MDITNTIFLSVIKILVIYNFVGKDYLQNLSRSIVVAQRVEILPARQETKVRSLGSEVPLEKRMAIHSSILAWRIPWTERPGRLQSMGSQRVGHD